MIHRMRGITLLETLIGMVLLVVIISLGVPAYSNWIRNNQIRNAAESVLNGLQLARSEAMKRNAIVRFQLTSTLTNSCALSTTGRNWVVSQDSAVGGCAATPSDTTAPRIIQRWSVQESAPSASISATLSGGSNASVAFDSFGRVQTTSLGSTISRIDIGISGATAGTNRNLRVVVSPGGRVLLCDPAITTTGDTRACP